jgi:hypothetical protein
MIPFPSEGIPFRQKSIPRGRIGSNIWAGASRGGGRGIQQAGGRHRAALQNSACPLCGNYFAPEYQLEWMAKTTGVSLDFLKTCQNCRK